MGKGGLTTDETIRWPCADVPGVTGPVDGVGTDDRGQEYCEYWAVLDGKLFAPDAEDGDEWRGTQVLGKTTNDGATSASGGRGDPYDYDGSVLNGEQQEWFDDVFNDDEVVGSCVFSSWHGETDAPVKGPTQRVHGMPVTFDNFHMVGRFNKNGAASQLIFDALQLPTLSEQEDKFDAMGNDFFRGCYLGQNIAVMWRFSDPTITAVINRLAECGCGIVDPEGKPVELSARQIGEAVIPPGGDFGDGRFLRGKPIGTWEAKDRLPDGCRYVQIDPGTSPYPDGVTKLSQNDCAGPNGETVACNDKDSQVLAVCDITLGDVRNSKNQSEMKEFCRTEYGNDVLVHVPLPVYKNELHLSCDAAKARPEFADGCSATPWVLELDPLSLDDSNINDISPDNRSCEIEEQLVPEDPGAGRGATQLGDES